VKCKHLGELTAPREEAPTTRGRTQESHHHVAEPWGRREGRRWVPVLVGVTFPSHACSHAWEGNAPMHAAIPPCGSALAMRAGCPRLAPPSTPPCSCEGEVVLAGPAAGPAAAAAAHTHTHTHTRSCEGEVLLLLRNSKHNDKTWGLPGGNCDPGETPLQVRVASYAIHTAGTVLHRMAYVVWIVWGSYGDHTVGKSP
jgi:hypothetical protein